MADPNYFDFISFAQYSTISREIADPQAVFEEQQPVEVGENELQKFNTVVVKRDTTIPNSQLPQRHTEIVGNAIYDKLNDKFGDTASAIPKIPTREIGDKIDESAVLAAIKQMVNLFLVQGFAWDGNATMQTSEGGGGATQFTITFTSPATLWSGQSLQAKNAVLLNDFAAKTGKSEHCFTSNSCVHCEVSAIWILHLSLTCLCVTNLANHMY